MFNYNMPNMANMAPADKPLTKNIPNIPNVIVALDYDNELDTMKLVSRLDPKLCKLKVGNELFTRCGSKLVEKLILSGFDVFLDLKFHDIPNTVYKACRVATSLGVWMLNVHINGGTKMLEMAKKAIDESSTATYKPLLIGVTVLTSITQEDLQELTFGAHLESQVNLLAQLANNCGLDGVVSSAHESKSIKQITRDDFLTVCPGIRKNNTVADDQKRTMDITEAIKNQVDFLVIGRPITQAPNPYISLVEAVGEARFAYVINKLDDSIK